MTDIRAATVGFEAKKDRLVQQQDVLWKITLVVQQIDMPEHILKAPMGTRFMIGAAEIGDDEEPIAPEKSEKTPAEKPEKTPGEKAVIRAGILCKDKLFWEWAMWEPHFRQGDPFMDEDDCAGWLCKYLGIVSRKEIGTNGVVFTQFNEICGRFEEWKRCGDPGRNLGAG